MGTYDGLAAVAEEIARGARAVSLAHFRESLDIEVKDDDSPVTCADRETEQWLRARLQERFPDAGVLGEEGGAARLDADTVWIIDPIDGTRAYLTGSPLFGTLLAQLERGRPVVGVIDMPALEETWIGAVGRATRYLWKDRKQPARTRRCRDLGAAIVSTTSTDMFDAAARPAFERLSEACRFRHFGGDCYQYGRLACGQLDLVAEASMKPYDYLPLVPIVEGAGGSITDWSGEPLGLHSDGRVLAAATPELHRAALAVLNR